MNAIKAAIKRTFLYDVLTRFRGRAELRAWLRNGKPDPVPSLCKQETVREYAGRFSLKTLVETGTYLGDMVRAVRASFTKIISIELDRALHEQAVRLFAKWPHITLLQGDSGAVLREVARKIPEPCLFWLDAHYSGGITARGDQDTPVLLELEAVLERGNRADVVLIDDARCFTGRDGYPTISELQGLLQRRRREWSLEVRDDILRLPSLQDLSSKDSRTATT